MKTGGLSTVASTLEDAAKGLGMQEAKVMFTAKQMADLSTLLRRIMGGLNYQDFAVAAMIELLNRAFEQKSNAVDIKGPFTSLMTAIARSNNDSIGQLAAVIVNVDSARRQAAIKSSDQTFGHRKDLLMEAPLMSKDMFNGVPAQIKNEVFSDNQNRAMIASMKRTGGQGFKPQSKSQPNKPTTDAKSGAQGRRFYPQTQGQTSKRKASTYPQQAAKKQRFSDKRPLKPGNDGCCHVGGRIGKFIQGWEEVAADNKLVMAIVRRGFQIPFQTRPPLTSIPADR